MMPWGHFAVAFLPYLLYTLLRHRKLPGKQATLAILVASQLPDLVDKPLSWSLHLLPSGRMFFHSVVIAVPLVVGLTLVSMHFDRTRLGALVAFGWLSHIYADSYHVIGQGADYYFLPNLYWPLVPAVPDHVPAFLPHFTRISTERYGIAVLVVAFVGLVLVAPTVRELYHDFVDDLEGRS